MNEEFNLSLIENEELHLQPTNFTDKLPRNFFFYLPFLIFLGIGNNKTIWPPPKILKNQRFEMEKSVLSTKQRILFKLKEFSADLKEKTKTVLINTIFLLKFNKRKEKK